ncbi:hypothetical protein FLAV_00475 [Flavobacteriales bacterium]|nr:hypothetical protein [Flavobacteriales bacterium]CAG0956617.1 hypothetical protein FLAV_00475 [Flavobacteriales bacterium]
MRSPTEIQVFVSNPSDVNTEKEIVEKICERINSQLATINCDVRYLVKEWSKLIVKFAVNPQEEIESLLGVYDIYLGIWWKKFGSNTGIINPETGQDYGSGTYREFCLAYGNWSSHKIPEMYLFFKKELTTDLFESDVNAELSKVIDFRKKQEPNGFCHSFDNERDFERTITDLLWKKATQFCMGVNIERKESFVNDKIKLEILDSQSEIEKIPDSFVFRTISHFTSLKEKRSLPFLETEKQNLEQLIFTKKRIILLGDAGSGKSTELIRLFHKLNEDKSPLIPLFQRLNSYTPEKGIEDFLSEIWKKIPNNLLVLILDGLDEIQPTHFNTVVRQINAFSEKYKEIRILISCRTNFYELPINNSVGTLSEFEPYLINDINIPEAREYYSKKYSDSFADNFIDETFDKNVSDLIAKPFFLMLLSEHYSREKKLSLNRSELYEMFLLNRIEFDQDHFKTTVELRSKKQEIVALLQRVALSMEVLSKNQIEESEILQLISSDEFNSLKYCTAFKKKDGEEYIWQFEHNNIQEFLAAKALSLLDYNKVIKFIAFEPMFKKLIPSWVNTLSFLFSILEINNELFKKLLNWMLDNEKEIIVKFEPDKVPEDLRNQVFQGIFNYYKKHDVWIRSNKFSDKELARFGQSDTNLQFLIDELKDTENTRTVKINVFSLIGHFEMDNQYMKVEVEELLLKQIENNQDDYNFIHSAIYALKWAGLNSKNTIDKLMQVVGNQKNQYIRAAMYAILLKSEALESNVEYLTKGYELIDKKISGERSDVSLMDEGWNLKECVKNIKSPEGIKRLTEYIAESTRFDYGYDIEKVLKVIISNAVIAYNIDNTVFNSMLTWFQKDIRGFRMEKINLILQFFEQTNTKEKAFYQIWESIEDKERNKSLAIAKLISPKLMQFIIDEYQKHNVTNKEIENLYFDMGWVGNENQNNFKELIHKKTNVEIKEPERIDHDALRKTKLKKDFELLFDGDAFKKATIRVFEKEQKETLSFDELFEIRKVNNKWIDIEENYSGVAMQLLRSFVNTGQHISKNKVMNWFEKEGNEEWYRTSLIYEYLTNHKEIEVTKSQKQWIVNWCNQNVGKVNFKEAIQVNEDRNITFKTMAMYVWYFSRRFDIKHPKDVLLDMLSFDFFEGNDWVGIEYLISKLDNDDIVTRMLENIQKGISDNSVLKNHIKYLAQNKVEKSYPFILNEIVNTKRKDYQRREFLDVFFEFTKNIESLKTIIDQSDSLIKWNIIDKLKANSQEQFVEKYLLDTLKKENNSEEIGKAAEVLVTLQNLQGLKIYVDWVKENVKVDIETSRALCLNSIKSVDAIPYLLDLLELSYLKEIKVDHFDRFNSQVLGAFYNIGLESEENLEKVKSSLKKFIEEKSALNQNVKYILHTIERLEEQFYMNRAQSYTIKQVKEKLKLLHG